MGGRKRVLKIQQRLHGPRRWLSRWRVSAATWAPADGTRGSPLCAPARGSGGPARAGCRWGGRYLSVGVWGAVLWGQSGVSPARSLPSVCSPEPQRTSSTLWELQGDEGKPQHGADVLGNGHKLQTTDGPSQVCVFGGRWHSCPQHSSTPAPHPASQQCWDTPAPLHPPWRCPSSTGTAA